MKKGNSSRQRSAADFLISVQERLPTVLLNRDYASKILEVARNLPIVSVISYECRLSRDIPQVDLALCAYGDNDSYTIKNLSIPVSSGLATNKHALAVWRKVKNFGEFWADKQGYLRGFVSALWMNIDIVRDTDSFPEPWIYVIFADAHISTDLKKAMATKTLSLFEPDFPDDIIEQMHISISHLPTKSHLLGLGLQSARRKQTLRLIVYKMGLTEITRFLKVSGWPGDHADFQQRMQDFTTYAESLGLLFDVDDSGVSRQVGVEFYPSRTDMQQLTGLLQLLVEQSLCSQIKSEAIIEWARASGKRGQSNPERWVSHVKLSYEPGRILLAKIYLYHQFELDGPHKSKFN